MELPDYKMVQGGNTRVNMSSGAASQVGKAFASMGKDLEGAGMEVSGLFEEAEKQHNAGKMADLQLDLDQTYSSYKEKMAANPNNALQWRDEYSKLMESKQAQLDKTDMSRNLRDQSNAYFKRFQGKSGIDVSHTAHSTILANASKSAEIRIADLRARGEDEQAGAMIKDMVSNGGMLSSRGLQLEKEMEYEGILRGLGEQMEADPPKFVEDAEAGRIKGISDEELDRQIGKAKRLVSVKNMDDVNEVQNLIDGNSEETKTTAGLLAEMESRKMPATQQRSMFRYQTTRNNEVLQQHRNLPAQQEAIMARFNASLGSYVPNGEPQDEGYAERKNLLNHLNDSARKTELINKLDALRDGKEVQIKGKKGTVTDQQQRMFDREIEAHNNTKPKVEKRTLGYHLNQGFFNNPDNISPYFDEDGVEKIMNAKEKVGGKFIVTEAAQRKMFKQLYKSTPKSHGRTKFQRDMAFALTQGTTQSTISTYTDKEAGEEWVREGDLIHMRHGRQSSELQGLLNTGDIDKKSDVELNAMVSSVAMIGDPSVGWVETIFQTMKYEPVSEDDAEFADAYSKYANKNGLSPRPDDFKHFYDYRAAYEAGYLEGDSDGHLPSRFKKAGHPRTYMSPDGKDFSSRPTKGWTDTRDNSIVSDKDKPIGDDLLNMDDGDDGFSPLPANKESTNELDTGEAREYKELPITPSRASGALLPKGKLDKKLNKFVQEMTPEEIEGLKQILNG